MRKSRLAIGNNRTNRRRTKKFVWLIVALVLLISFIAIIPTDQEEVSTTLPTPTAREIR